MMKIYIASSWKNQHGVEMLTALLRADGHSVISWIENNYGENHNHVTKKFDFETWVNSAESNQSFDFDTKGATECDLLIYYGPAGKDACAELGAAWGAKVKIIGLWAKGEDLGLMRKMMAAWFDRHADIVKFCKEFSKTIKRNPYACYGNQRPHPMDFDTKMEYEERINAYLQWENSFEGHDKSIRQIISEIYAIARS